MSQQINAARRKAAVPATTASKIASSIHNSSTTASSHSNSNLVVLRYENGSCPNFISFRDTLHPYALTECGQVASIIKTNVEYVPPKVVLPTRELTESNDPFAVKRTELEQQVKDRAKEISHLRTIAKPKLYGIVWGAMSQDSRNKVIECQVPVDPTATPIVYHNDWAEVEAASDSTSLWKRILLTHHGVSTTIPVLDQSKAREDYERVRQSKSEQLFVYRDRFKMALETMTSTGATVETAAEQAARFVKGLDNARYAQFRADLTNDATRGTAKYPDTYEKVYDLASKYKLVSASGQVIEASAYITSNNTSRESTDTDSLSTNGSPNIPRKKNKNKNKQKNKNGGKADQSQSESASNNPNPNVCNRPCSICQAQPPLSHFQKDCPLVLKAREIFNSENKKGNKSKSGSVNFTFARSTLASNGQVLQTYQVGDPITLVGPNPEPAIKLNIALSCSVLPEDYIQLDQQANVSIFRNERLLKNIRPASIPCHVGGINRDGSPLIATLVGDYNEFRGVNYHPDASANILSFSETAEYCKNSYDGERNLFMCIPPSGRKYEYTLIDGLYAYHDKSEPQQYNQVYNTVSSNKLAYTKRQVQDAEKARNLMKLLAYPAEDAAINAINKGAIINTPITAHDIHRANKIFGPDLASLRGKTHKHPSHPIKNEYLPRQVPSEVTLNTDVMFVGDHAFLISVLTPVSVTLTTHLGSTKGSRSKAVVRKSLNAQISEVTRRRFVPIALNTDGEGAIHSLGPELAEKGIELNPTGAGAHVHVVERKVQEVKERVRGVINSLPFKLALTLIVWLVLFCVSRINLIPHKGGPIGISPSEAFKGRKTNAAIDLRVGFGDYAECTDPYGDNTMRPRTQAAIALLPVGNLTGSVYFLSLATGRVIRRDQFKVLPMPDNVIAHLNKMAEISWSKTNQNPSELNFSMAGSDNFVLDNTPDNSDDTSIYDPPVIDILAEELSPNPDVVLEEHIADSGPSHPTAATTLPLEEESNPTNTEAYTDDPADSSEPSVELHNAPPEPRNVPASPEIRNSPREIHNSPGSRLHNASPPTELHNVPPQADTTSGPDPPPSVDPPPHGYFTRSSVRGDSTTSITERARLAAIKRNTWYVNNKSRAYHSATALHITVNKAMKTMSKKALNSMFKEVNQMLNMKVWRGVKPTFKEKKKVIKSFMFLKEKFDSQGNFDKLKSRLVAGGHMQDRTFMTEDDSSSPTAALSSIFTIAAIAARDRRHVRTVDIAGAYLNADISDKHILMELDETVSAILIALDPSYTEYLQPNGKIIVELQKALYGCIESGKLWYDLLSATLESLGYVRNAVDQCVFNKTVNGKQCTVAVYVDDLFISSAELSLITELENKLKSEFKQIEIHEGPLYSYLGMSWDYSVPGEVKVTMEGFIADLMKWSEIEGTVLTPAANHLFETREAEKLPTDKAEFYHSAAAKLLYLSKRVRPDIILAVSFLTTRVQSPDVDDWSKLQRVLKYLNGTQEMGIVLRPDKSGKHEAYIDASYGIHADGKSHSGMILTLGLGPLLVKSTKQKINTKSSTEAELIALSDLCSPVIWNREFLIAQGENLKPTTVYQDNQSTMALVNKGASTSERTRHIKIRYFWVKDQVDNGEIQIVYVPTEDMTADILTKPLQGEHFLRLRQLLLNWSY